MSTAHNPGCPRCRALPEGEECTQCSMDRDVRENADLYRALAASPEKEE